MRCLGITKSFKRCKKPCRAIYCHNHRLQWWAVILIIATLAGLYQDIFRPLFANHKNPNKELVELLSSRKKKIDTAYEQVILNSQKVEGDTSVDKLIRQKVSIAADKIMMNKIKVDNLINWHIKTLGQEQPIWSNKIYKDIFTEFAELKIDTSILWFTTDTIYLDNEALNDFSWGLRNYCLSGSYYIMVRTDAENVIFESTDSGLFKGNSDTSHIDSTFMSNCK